MWQVDTEWAAVWDIGISGRGKRDMVVFLFLGWVVS